MMFLFSQTYRDLFGNLLYANPAVLVVSATCLVVLVVNNEVLKVCSGGECGDNFFFQGHCIGKKKSKIRRSTLHLK